VTDRTEAESSDIPTFDDVVAARERITPYIHRTPVLTSCYFNQLTGAELFFKCENFQKAGVFKVRGASNAVFGLSEEQARNGVATHSSGNHAASLSYAAGRRGIKASVVMPRTASEAKKAAVRTYGGEVFECEPSMTAREAMLEEMVARTGADFVHPYNDHRVITGQATCALELHEEVGPLDAVVAPIGGGGMISGTCLTMSRVSPETRIYAAEPNNADDAYRSFKAGKIIEDDAPETVADGLKVSLRPLTWHFVSTYLSGVLLASEEEIIDAMYLTWQRMKIVIEPSSSVPLATIIKNRELFAGKRVGVILTGGNVDFKKLPWMNNQGSSD
jgi:threonine dehydratase